MKKTLLFLIGSCSAFFSQASTEKSNLLTLLDQSQVQYGIERCNIFVAYVLSNGTHQQSSTLMKKKSSIIIPIEKTKKLEQSLSTSPVSVSYVNDMQPVRKRQVSFSDELLNGGESAVKVSKQLAPLILPDSSSHAELSAFSFDCSPTKMLRVHSSLLANMNDHATPDCGPTPEKDHPTPDCGPTPPQDYSGMRSRSNSNSSDRSRANSGESLGSNFYLGSISRDSSTDFCSDVSSQQKGHLTPVLEQSFSRRKCHGTPNLGKTPSPRK